jgi:isopenicillin N synthase-like dioxygenase
MVEGEIVSRQQISRLRASGFVLCNVPQVFQDSIKKVYGVARPFFRADLGDKKISILSEEAGYRPFGSEYSNSPVHPDQVESFTVHKRVPDPTRILSPLALALWTEMMNIFDVFENLAESVVNQMIMSIANNSPAYRNLHGALGGWSRLQLNYSRPSQVRSSFINEVHEDGDLVTFANATGPGLEIRTGDESFLSVTTKSDELVIMPGELAWLLSGGHFNPAFHRVHPNPIETERMALLFFADIDPTLSEPWIHNEINNRIDIKNKILTNVKKFGLKGFSDF